MKNVNMKQVMKDSHRKTREFVEKYGVDYQAQLGLFISYFIEEAKKEEQANKEYNLETWNDHYLENQNLYGYLLYNSNILDKNGRETISQEQEAKNTATYHQIIQGNEEDIKNDIYIKMVEKFHRDKTIEGRFIQSTYKMIAFNVLKSYRRAEARFRANVDPSHLDTAWNDNREQVIITNDEDAREVNFLRMELEKLADNGELDETDLQVIQFTMEGYNNIEIGELIGYSRQTVHNRLEKIRKVMIDNKLVNLG